MPIPSAPSPWVRLYADLKISIPGVTDAVLEQELFRCAKDFFDQTNIWVEDVPVAVTPNLLIYILTLAGKGAINRLLLVYDPAAASPDKRWVQGGIGMGYPGQITLRYAPSQAETWMATVAKTPVDPTDPQNYPDIDSSAYWIVDKYRDAFYYGTLARVQIQPSKTYSNPKMAGINMQQYIYQRGKARTDATKSNVYGGQRWMFPQDYATTTRKGWT